MRLALHKRPPERNRVLLGAVLSPDVSVAAAMDVELVFVEAYQRLHGRFLDRAERSVGKDDARDVVGDTWTSIWISLPTLAREKWNDSYFFGVVHHFISAKHRKNKRLVSLDDAEIELERRAMGAMEDGGRDDLAEVLDAALATMAPRRREVLLLVYEESLTYEEAGEALGLSFGTIKTHLRLAMQELRTAFTRAGYRIAIPQARQRQLPSPKGGDSND